MHFAWQVMHQHDNDGLAPPNPTAEAGRGFVVRQVWFVFEDSYPRIFS